MASGITVPMVLAENCWKAGVVGAGVVVAAGLTGARMLMGVRMLTSA
ncbi:hypothetical protein [Bradyrhizobium sp. CCBAU 51753]|nr:hypothetical protein [Bradyrhizobium sp. CCBAU 51753]